MHSLIPVKDVYPRALDEARAIIEVGSQNEAAELRSPELLEKIVWGVVVNFFVCIAANLATSLKTVSKKRTLSDADVDQIRNIFESSTVQVCQIPQETLEKAIGNALPDWISTDQKPELSRQLAKALTNVVNSSHADE